ncbi:MAG: hypothetical protein AVDCRST_MAG85-797, partial [uncultured Solirubrobacteraceae bacterium]
DCRSVVGGARRTVLLALRRARRPDLHLLPAPDRVEGRRRRRAPGGLHRALRAPARRRRDR